MESRHPHIAPLRLGANNTLQGTTGAPRTQRQVQKPQGQLHRAETPPEVIGYQRLHDEHERPSTVAAAARSTRVVKFAEPSMPSSVFTMTITKPHDNMPYEEPDAYHEDLASCSSELLMRDTRGYDTCKRDTRTDISTDAIQEQSVRPHFNGVVECTIFAKVASNQLTMRGIKRRSEGHEDGSNKAVKLTAIGIGEVSVHKSHLYVLDNDALNEEYCWARAYVEEVCKEMSAREGVYEGGDSITTVGHSQKRGGPGELGFEATEKASEDHVNAQLLQEEANDDVASRYNDGADVTQPRSGLTSLISTARRGLKAIYVNEASDLATVIEEYETEDVVDGSECGAVQEIPWEDYI